MNIYRIIEQENENNPLYLIAHKNKNYVRQVKHDTTSCTVNGKLFDTPYDEVVWFYLPEKKEITWGRIWKYNDIDFYEELEESFENALIKYKREAKLKRILKEK